MPQLSAARLREVAQHLLVAARVAPEEAAIVAESLVESNLAGHDSHGVARIVEYLEQIDRGELRPGAEWIVERDLPAVFVADAQMGFGQVQMRRLLDVLLDKARATGLACGTLRDSGHIGRLGEYTSRAAQAGFAAWLTVNDNGVLRTVAPPGGLVPQLSTNPLSIAVPAPAEIADSGAIVLDISTSVVAQGKVMLRRQSGKPCPEGWLQDAAGQPSTDPFILQARPPGALLPLGGPAAYKGFGLALLLDMLVGGLSGGFCPPPRAGARLTNNVLMLLWNPEMFAGRDHLLAEVRSLAESVRDCPVRDGGAAIRLPGDQSAATRQARLTEGIPLADGTWNALLAAGARRGLSLGQE